jgi:hypothetical protein
MTVQGTAKTNVGLNPDHNAGTPDNILNNFLIK